MNYKKIYNNLIKTRNKLKRSGSDATYYEEHHIIPRCEGGEDTKENLVLLTAREHFVAHRLLTKIYPDSFGLKLAVLWMASIEDITATTFISSRTYSKLREDVSAARISRISHEDTMELVQEMKSTNQFTAVVMGFARKITRRKKLRSAINKYLANLIIAKYFGFNLTYTRNTANVKGQKVTIKNILEAEKVLLEIGYLREVFVDSISPLAHRKRCRAVASDKIKEFDHCLEKMLEMNRNILLEKGWINDESFDSDNG